jgi:hypothetical protein
VIGDKRKFLSCLVTLRMKPTASGDDFTEELAGASASVDPSCKTIEDAMSSAVWRT